MEDRTLRMGRRSFLAAMAGGAAVALLGSNNASASATITDKRLNHLAWVWQFNEDGERAYVRSVLAQNNMGILLKTHDSTSWLGRWDRSVGAIRGALDVQTTAAYFESAGVPFHAWCVVKGVDPIREAEICAEVLSHGARSLILDLEPPEDDDFWQGTPQDALTFGRELRRLQSNAWIGFAPDPRPWQARAVPTPEFASFCNEIVPQTYWDTYSSPANYQLMREFGYQVNRETFTAEFLLTVAHDVFSRYGLPIRPIGQGTSSIDSWRRFVDHAYRLGMDAVSVWRFGVVDHGVWSLLKEMQPQQPVTPQTKIASPTPSAATPAKVVTEEKKAEPAIVRSSMNADIRKMNPYATDDGGLSKRVSSIWTGKSK